MRYDIENQLSVAQDFTATAVSTNSYKKQSAVQDLSIGRLMCLVVYPTVAAGAGSTHVLAAIQTTDSALTAGLVVLGSITVVAANLIVGSKHIIPIPQGTMNLQYIGFRDSISGGTTTVTLDVYLVPQDEIAKYKSFTKVNDALV